MTRSIRTAVFFASAISALLVSTPVFANGNNYSHDEYSHYTYNSENDFNHSYYADQGDRSYNHEYDAANRPSCSIAITNASGSYGYDRSITLGWSSSYATSAILSTIGSVGTNGAQAVMYPFNRSYTLTVHGPGGSATCTTQNSYYTAQYENDSYYANNYVRPLYRNTANSYPTYTYPTYTAPTYRYIQLSQTPYTGFDFGLIGNMFYWLGMILVAMGGAYLIVYYRGWRPLSLVRQVARAAENQIRVVRSVIS